MAIDDQNNPSDTGQSKENKPVVSQEDIKAVAQIKKNLRESSSALNSISEAIAAQTDWALQLNRSFENYQNEMIKNSNNIVSNTQDMLEVLSETSENISQSYNPHLFGSFQKANTSTVRGIKAQAQIFQEMSDVSTTVISEIQTAHKNINSTAIKSATNSVNSIQVAKEIVESLGQTSEGVQTVNETVVRDQLDILATQKGINEVIIQQTKDINTVNTQSEKITGDLLEGLSNTTEGLTAVTHGVSDIVDNVQYHDDIMDDFLLNIYEANEGLQDLSTTTEELNDAVSSFGGGAMNILKTAGSALTSVFKLVSGVVLNTLTLVSTFVKLVATLPFTVMKVAAKIGNKLRQDIVEVIGMASEELKEKFDMNSTIGEGIMAMTNRGKGMLKAFQNPSSYLVKLFGMGAAGIANMIKELGTQVESMGHFSELFGKSLGKNGKLFEEYITMVRGLGLTAEDVGYLAMDAGNQLMHVNVRMRNLTATITNVSEEYGLDRKRLSKNFMMMRKNIIQFGHLTDEELARTTANMTQLKVKMEDATAVFDKFSTFEDAANSVAMLSQTFGMNLNAMDMIQAKNPEDIIEMFRNSMFETGRAFQDLNRFEKDLMSQHTGMSAESLSALMNYRDMGLTYEEARKKMESQRPEAKQMAAIKDLNSAIKQFQKVLTFDSPFQAFMEGIINNTTLTGDLKNVLVSVSEGYQGIYDFASSLKTTEWYEIARPLKMIIDIMSSILKSEEFRKGLQTGLEVASTFVSTVFGVSTGERALSALEIKIKSATSKGGVLDARSKDPVVVKNRALFLDAFQGLGNSVISPFIAKAGFTSTEFSNVKTDKDMFSLLSKLQNAVDADSSLKPALNDLMFKISERAKLIPEQLKQTFGQKIKGKEKAVDFKAYESYVEELDDMMMTMIRSNDKNTAKFGNLIARITRALIVGGAIAATALLRMANKMIKKGKAEYDKMPDDYNMIEGFLKMKKGELGNLTSDLTKAFSEFMSNSTAMFSLTKWFLGGFLEIFGTISGTFLMTFKDKMAEYFPTIFGNNGAKPKLNARALGDSAIKANKGNLDASSTLASAKAQNAVTGKTGIQIGADLVTGMRQQSGSIKDTSQRSTMLSFSQNLSESFGQAYVPEKHTDIAPKMEKLLGTVKDGQFTGNIKKIELLNKLYKEGTLNQESLLGILFGNSDTRSDATFSIGKNMNEEDMSEIMASVDKASPLGAGPQFTPTTPTTPTILDLDEYFNNGAILNDIEVPFVEKNSFNSMLSQAGLDIPKLLAAQRGKSPDELTPKQVGSIVDTLRSHPKFINMQEELKQTPLRLRNQKVQNELKGLIVSTIKDMRNQAFPDQNNAVLSANAPAMTSAQPTKDFMLTAIAGMTKIPDVIKKATAGIKRPSLKSFSGNIADKSIVAFNEINRSVNDLSSNMMYKVPSEDLFKQTAISESSVILEKYDKESVGVVEFSGNVNMSDLYNTAKIVKDNSKNKISKKKVEEMKLALTEHKKGYEDKEHSIDSKLVLNKEIIDLLAAELTGPLVTKNLARAFTDPRFTQGVMSMKEDVFTSPTLNTGSDSGGYSEKLRQ